MSLVLFLFIFFFHLLQIHARSKGLFLGRKLLKKELNLMRMRRKSHGEFKKTRKCLKVAATEKDYSCTTTPLDNIPN